MQWLVLFFVYFFFKILIFFICLIFQFQVLTFQLQHYSIFSFFELFIIIFILLLENYTLKLIFLIFSSTIIFYSCSITKFDLDTVFVSIITHLFVFLLHLCLHSKQYDHLIASYSTVSLKKLIILIAIIGSVVFKIVISEEEPINLQHDLISFLKYNDKIIQLSIII